ncbi:MAG: polysaccharide pyruvyl transferase CsaB [Candidatus Margulisiibacteriota bacterium]
MRNILIVGYYGYENAGDELLLRQTVEIIRSQNQDAFCYILYNKRNIAKAGEIPNSKLIDRWSFFGIISALKKVDTVIYGGGGLFQDTTSAKSFLYYLGILILALIQKKQVYFLAQGFSHIKRTWLRLIFRIALKKVMKISVRDEASFDAFKKLGYPLSNLYLATDLAFNQELKSCSKIILPLNQKTSVNVKPETNEFIGISFRVFRNLDLNKEVLAQFLNQFDKKNLVFLNLQPPFDYEAFRDLLPLKSVNKVIDLKDYLLNNQPLSDKLNLVVGMRYHALVYAALHEIPFLALAYDQKVKNLAIEFEQEYLDLTKPLYLVDFIKKYNKVTKNLDFYQAKIEANLQKQLQKAQNNVKIFEG